MSNPTCLFLPSEKTHYPCTPSLQPEVQWHTPGAQWTRSGIGRCGNWAFYFAHFSLGAVPGSWSPHINTNRTAYTSVVHQREQPGLLWEWQQRFMPVKLIVSLQWQASMKHSIPTVFPQWIRQANRIGGFSSLFLFFFFFFPPRNNILKNPNSH